MKIKQILAATALAATSVSATAAPMLDSILAGAPSLSSHGSEFFHLTDTDGLSDNFLSQIILEQASYESNMGIYSFDVDASGNVAIGNTLQVFCSI